MQSIGFRQGFNFQIVICFVEALKDRLLSHLCCSVSLQCCHFSKKGKGPVLCKIPVVSHSVLKHTVLDQPLVNCL